MNARRRGDEERLPVVHRTVRLPAGLWKAVKARSARDGKAVRFVIDEAMDAQLTELVQLLRRLGLKGEAKANKLVRLPLDENVLARLKLAKRQTGMPAIFMLTLYLMLHTEQPEPPAGEKRRG